MMAIVILTYYTIKTQAVISYMCFFFKYHVKQLKRNFKDKGPAIRCVTIHS